MRKLLPFFIIFIFAAIGLKSLIESPFYTSHDGFTHTARIAAYKKILSDGQIPPRWASDLNGQLGSPIFVYSYPFPYLVGSTVHALGLSYQDSFRAVMAFSFIAGSIGMYLWLKTKFGVLPGLTAAIFYMFVPYRFLNLYVRAAFAESFAYAVAPFIFLSIEKYKKSENKTLWWSVTALLISLLLLSHNVVAAIFLPLIFAWIILTFWKKWLSLGKLIMAMLIGFAMSSFIYVPDLLELHFVRFNQGISYYKEHFVEFFQLIRSPWGYGFDLPGTLNDAMSFQLGLAQLLVLVLLIALIIIKRPKNLELYFFLAVLAVTLILMVNAPYSIQLWQAVPMLTTIVDFPWRFLGLAAFIFAFLSAYLVKELPLKLFVVAVLLFAVLIANRNFTRVNEKLSFSDSTFENYTGTSTATSNEYQPILHKTSSLPQKIEPVTVLRGEAEITNTFKNSKVVAFTVSSSESAVLRVNRFYFPNTEVYKDGTKITNWEIKTEQGNSEIDDSGTMTIAINPPGGSYEVRFVETPLRNFANIISGIAFIGTLTILFLSLVKRHVKK